jgi:hypothetical protein
MIEEVLEDVVGMMGMEERYKSNVLCNECTQITF